MDSDIKQIAELLSAGFDAGVVRTAFKIRRELLSDEAPTNGHAMALSVEPPSQPQPRPTEPPPPPDDSAARSVRSIVDELIPYDDFETAPSGTKWEIPIFDIAGAGYHRKTGGAHRTPKQCRGAVIKALSSRGQDKASSASCRKGAYSITVVKR